MKNKLFHVWITVIVSLIFVINSVNGAKFKVTSKVSIDISDSGKFIGNIVIGLFDELAPKTSENFRTICEKGINGKSYVGTPFHRVIDKFIIQGGDIIYRNGSGSISIYGKYFEDENLEINHTVSGFVAMANRGPDTNGCQFYITTMAAPWLNGKHTIFGKVLEGQATVHKVEKVKTDTDDCPESLIKIEKCEVISVDKPFVISDDPYDLWGWIKASAVPLGMSFSILGFFHYIFRKLDKYG